jgi:hypothetical protein
MANYRHPTGSPEKPALPIAAPPNRPPKAFSGGTLSEKVGSRTYGWKLMQAAALPLPALEDHITNVHRGVLQAATLAGLRKRFGLNVRLLPPFSHAGHA